jgi:hypothetical protein
MSAERELLKECRLMLDNLFNGTTGINLRDRISELLAQPEQNPMTAQEISQGFRADNDAINAESYWAGVVLAEKHYGVKRNETL